MPLTGAWQKSGFSDLLNILPRINFCAGLTVSVLRNPLLRQAPKRCGQAKNRHHSFIYNQN